MLAQDRDAQAAQGRGGAVRWLIGYSRCPHTRAAFEARGHEVWTCDLLPADHPRHLQCDVWEVLGDNWGAAILHPMCTYLTVSAAWAFNDPNFDRYPGVGFHQKVKPGTLTGSARKGTGQLPSPSRSAVSEGDRKSRSLFYIESD